MIGKNLAHIWVGPLPAPQDWMQTWQDFHKDWNYQLYNNDYLTSRKFRNQSHIIEYFERGEYAGVSDLIRYEILFDEGGFIPEADSRCLRRCDELTALEQPFTCYEVLPEVCDKLGMPRKKGLLQPIFGSPQSHTLLNQLITEIGKQIPEKMPKPWKGSGNHRLRRFFEDYPDLKACLKIYPAHFFCPEHFRGWKYSGNDDPFCEHIWGTTKSIYPGQNTQDPAEAEDIRQNILAKMRRWL